MHWRSLRSEYPTKYTPCLVRHNGNYKILLWSALHQCWEDADRSYYCDKESINRWCPLSEIIKYLDEDDEMP